MMMNFHHHIHYQQEIKETHEHETRHSSTNN
jgi:hypothetical protein